MLSSEEIEKRLGELTVNRIEAVISAGIDAVGRSDNPEEGMEAMQALLLSILAATAIMPIEGAKDRAEELSADLIELVDAAVAEHGSTTSL